MAPLRAPTPDTQHPVRHGEANVISPSHLSPSRRVTASAILCTACTRHRLKRRDCQMLPPIVVTITRLHRKTASVVQEAAASSSPVFVTQNSLVTAVLLHRRLYDRLLRAAEKGAAEKEAAGKGAAVKGDEPPLIRSAGVLEDPLAVFGPLPPGTKFEGAVGDHRRGPGSHVSRGRDRGQADPAAPVVGRRVGPPRGACAPRPPSTLPGMGRARVACLGHGCSGMPRRLYYARLSTR